MILDAPLKFEDIQSLSSRDAVNVFFTALGYDTQRRVTQSASNLGIGTDSVVREIKHIEQLVAQDGLLHVYLFELSSVTVVLTNALARAFRNKQGEYLLVLTDNYERIDFVLVERAIPNVDSAEGIGQKQVSIRPRALTIDRRKPTRRQLRVLRRFTYTESDPVYQFEKLKSAYAIYDWSEDHFNNRILFADYYLQERLRDRDEWREDPKPLFLKVQELMVGAAHIWTGKREVELRKGLYEKLFAILGFTFKAQKRADDDAMKPDYLLFGASTETPIAACLCYPWARSLDGKDDQRDADTPEENPSAAVVSVLKEAGVSWAIVTNGKLWRLYNAKTSSIAASFYEIDLEEVLAIPSELASPTTYDLGDSFKYFSLFFRREAYEPRTETAAGEQRATTFLDTLLKGSEEYAKKLGERLKDRVFDEVFIHLSMGFVENIRKRDGKQADLSQEKLDEVFQGTLTLLYRLLFMLYAEARDLFPVKEIRGYYEKSLKRLKEEVAELAGPAEAEVTDRLAARLTVSETGLYDRLLELFRVVDLGEPSINVPMYNGGLFLSNPADDDDSEDARLARFLFTTKVPDRYLARGLDLLARDEDDKTCQLVPIDYKSLGVRQLGSIYEGLLEFKLRVAREKMAVVKGKKTEEIVPYDEAVKEKRKILTERRNGEKGERVIPRGRLYLENDKRERKATGSYYTPDYIVKYIVENTVGPVLKEKFDKLAAEFRRAQKDYREALKRREEFIKRNMKPEDPEKAALNYKGLVNELFDVKVLDPAMGSGHFLVEAADFISDRLIDFLNGFPWNPVLSTLRATRNTILEEMDRQGVVIDKGRLTDVNLIKRHVLKRCIYGVDLNPMAVELAKVSLWLNCFTLGAPLSFLDHHLKCGNSLINVTVEKVREKLETGQMMFGGTEFAGLMLATELMRHVGELSDVTSQQVKQSKQEFRKATDALAPFKRILDVYTSRWFGNGMRIVGAGKHRRKVDPTVEFLQTPDAGAWLSSPRRANLKGEFKRIAEVAYDSAASNRYFHWELEFPEIFYKKGLKSQEGGFNVVLGNPPYSSKQSVETRTLSELYSAVEFKCDPFAFFVELATNLLCCRGSAGLIVPASWMTNFYYHKLRRLLVSKQLLQEVILFDGQVFESANVDTSILLLSERGDLRDRFQLASAPAGAIGEGRTTRPYSEVLHLSRCEITPPADGRWARLRSKLETMSVGLGEIAKISLGMKLKANDDFVQPQKDNTHPDPIIFGDDIQRYGALVPSRYFNHKVAVIVGGTKNPDVYSARPKLLVQAIRNLSLRRRLVSAVDDVGVHFVGTVNGIMPKDTTWDVYFLQALIASNLLNSFFASRFITISLTAAFLGELPIRRVDFSLPQKERALLAGTSEKICNAFFGSEERHVEVMAFVNQQLEQGKYATNAMQSGGTTAEYVVSAGLHDLLARLGRKMIDLNKERQSEMWRFLRWLEKRTQMDPGIEALSGKTPLTGYLGDYQVDEGEVDFGAILSVLHKNKGRLGVSLSQPKLVAELREEYDKSLSVLLPIKRRVAATDKLIDQIVYRLYGLTEEEIRIVEGK